jgi:NADH:ubiquinone oxidoreductase subunit 3 (subunit A)
MQGIYTHIPETNNVHKQYNVAAILLLLFMVPISLAPALALMYFYISTFRSMCTVPCMVVFCSSFYYYYYYYWGPRWHSWVRHCVTSRKVAGSIHDRIVGILH